MWALYCVISVSIVQLVVAPQLVHFRLSSRWLKHPQLVLIWEQLTPAWGFSSMEKSKSLPTTRATGRPPHMLHLPTPSVSSEMPLRTKWPWTPITQFLVSHRLRMTRTSANDESIVTLMQDISTRILIFIWLRVYTDHYWWIFFYYLVDELSPSWNRRRVLTFLKLRKPSFCI